MGEKCKGGPVRVAFVGVGKWADFLAAAARKSRRVEIAACWSRSEAGRTGFAGRHGGVAKKTYQDLLADEGIDAVIITTPNSLHAPQTIEALQHGKHVFVEKPMALSVGDCKRMIAAAKEAGRILAVGHKERRLARMRKAKELIDKGAVGQVVLVEASHSDNLGTRLTPQMWQWYRKETPGGPICSLNVHHADNMNHLIGPVEKVTAFISKVCGPAETDDVISAAVKFESGVLGYLGGAYITPQRKFFQVHGTEGIILVDQEGGAIYHQKKGTVNLIKIEGLPDDNTQRADSSTEEIDEFAACIQEGGKPETGGEEGLAAWAVMEAIIRSAKSGAAVTIQDVLAGD